MAMKELYADEQIFDNTDDNEGLDEHCLLDCESSDEHSQQTIPIFQNSMFQPRTSLSWLLFFGTTAVTLIVLLNTNRDIFVESHSEELAPLVMVIDENCSCFHMDRNCCQRQILRNHKFGFILSEKLYGSFAPNITSTHITPKRMPKANSTSLKDYRQVVLLRNMFDAIVSGYLYHQSGHECWLSAYGEPVPEKRQRNMDWERYTRDIQFAYPPGLNRSMCHYLADEDADVGMRVYIHVALRAYYLSIEGYLVELEQRRQVDPVDRTLLVCFEDITNASKQLNIFGQTMDFLYPGGHEYYTIPQQPEVNAGGHASSHDPTTRDSLLHLVHELDENMFGGVLQRLNSLYDCGNDR
ncbi:hypothetical protein MPSEU_001091600 [Mayamaea pseudoterrestris]|nr:hypothetical protein MPSEU_001091600 [Mayamaea pseudoterrestris]